jgi:hypothetical protein
MWIRVLSCLLALTTTALVAYAQSGGNAKCCTGNFTLCTGCYDTDTLVNDLEAYVNIGTNEVQICYHSGSPDNCTMNQQLTVCYESTTAPIYNGNQTNNCADLVGTMAWSKQVDECDPTTNSVCG